MGGEGGRPKHVDDEERHREDEMEKKAVTTGNEPLLSVSQQSGDSRRCAERARRQRQLNPKP